MTLRIKTHKKGLQQDRWAVILECLFI